jgi:hypothetical protein
MRVDVSPELQNVVRIAPSSVKFCKAAPLSKVEEASDLEYPQALVPMSPSDDLQETCSV